MGPSYDDEAIRQTLEVRGWRQCRCRLAWWGGIWSLCCGNDEIVTPLVKVAVVAAQVTGHSFRNIYFQTSCAKAVFVMVVVVSCNSYPHTWSSQVFWRYDTAEYEVTSIYIYICIYGILQYSFCLHFFSCVSFSNWKLDTLHRKTVRASRTSYY